MEDFTAVSELPFGFKVRDEAVVKASDFGETGLGAGVGGAGLVGEDGEGRREL